MPKHPSNRSVSKLRDLAAGFVRQHGDAQSAVIFRGNLIMATAKPVTKKAKRLMAGKPGKTRQHRTHVGNSELPRKTLEDCLAVARPVHEVYAGKSASWDEITSTAGMSSKSNTTKYLIWSAQAYGLLVKEGASYALSETARKIFAPNDGAEKAGALVKAITVPTILSKFYTEYNGKLLPEDTFFDNVLENQYQIPRDRTKEARELIVSNAVFAGILTSHENGKKTIRLDGNGARLGSSASYLPDDSSESLAVEAVGNATLSSKNSDQTCFYITPIGEESSEVRRHADMLLKHLVEPAFGQFGIRVVRADKIEKSGLITKQIFEHVVSAKYCVADLSFGNPNAFYELGIRHMTRLPTIQLIRKGDKIPFDVSQGRTIVVDMGDIYTIMDRMDSARRELIEHIKNYREPSDKIRVDDNPVAAYLPDIEIKIPKAQD
jgi:hypothetical protein